MSRKKTSCATSSRFTVSLPDPLMRVLDRLRTARRYGNRSEFVRDLLRRAGEGGLITAALHVHLDAHTCLEAIPLRGPAREIQQVANRLLSVTGVRYGQLVPATARRLS